MIQQQSKALPSKMTFLSAKKEVVVEDDGYWKGDWVCADCGRSILFYFILFYVIFN